MALQKDLTYKGAPISGAYIRIDRVHTDKMPDGTYNMILHVYERTAKDQPPLNESPIKYTMEGVDIKSLEGNTYNAAYDFLKQQERYEGATDVD